VEVSFHWARVFILLLFLFSLGLAIPLFVGGLEVITVLSTLPYWTAPLLFLVMVLAWNLNLLRLCVLLDGQVNNLGYWKIMRIYMATEFVSKTTPMGVGAPAAAVSLLAPHGVKPISCLVIFGVSACMDAIVLVCLIGFFAVGELTMTLGANLVTGVSFISAFMLTAIACMALLLYHHKLLFYLLLHMPGFSLIGQKGKKNAGKLIVSLHRTLKRISELALWRLFLSWSACLLYWGVCLSTLYLCIWMLGGGVSWLESSFIQTIAMGVGHLLMVPGGAGGAEVSGTLLLEPKLGATTAAAAIMLWRFLMLYLYLVVGGVSLLSLGVGAISYGKEKRANL
jgi:uncharacterized protein (TIRG00374 family)